MFLRSSYSAKLPDVASMVASVASVLAWSLHIILWLERQL